MIRDPLYQQIERALVGRVDPEVFQRCSVDLLSLVYPTLAQNVGGNDAGMDGTIGTPTGASQLIATTERDVIGNVRKSIKQRLKKRRKGPKRAIVATSQTLTSARKRNIEAAANKLGVQIENIHDGTDFVPRLYRNAFWRKELLGLAGNPPALSVYPPRVRDAAPDELYGRANDLEWLRHTPGDLIVSGQPGTGKTCLHEQLAKQGECLFVLDDCEAADIANAIREQTPRAIVVDDAHVRFGLVERLVSLRRETGADFAIHANSWPSESRAVAQLLKVPDSNRRTLEPLTRDEILELIKQRGVVGPDALLHLLIRDADGKPGLAAALVDACKRGETRKIWTGEALVDRLLLHHRGLSDERDRAILAMFALGGEWGVRMTAVADALTMSQTELRARVTSLAAGGVIQEVPEQALQVRPPGLRAALVKDVFFSGPTSISFPDKLANGLAPNEVAHVVLRARQIGGAVDLNRVRQVVQAAGDRETWEHFGFVDEQCARAILDDYPDQIAIAAPGVLQHLPDEALRLLFDWDVERSTSIGAIESPERRVREWLVGQEPHELSMRLRREQLLNAIEAWMQCPGNRDTDTASWAVAMVIDPRFELNRQVPGSGDRWTFIHGLMSKACLLQIRSIWPRVLRLVQQLPAERRINVRERIEDWCFPGRFAHGAIPEAVRTILRRHARTLLKDMVASDPTNPALLHWAQQISDWGSLRIRFATNTDFDLLYGDEFSSTDWQEQWRQRVASIERFADSLVLRPINEVEELLAGFERCAGFFACFRGTGARSALYRALAKRSENPVAWIGKWTTARGSALFIEAFVGVVVDSEPAAAIPLLERLIQDDKYATCAALFAIRIDEAPTQLLGAACTRLESCADQNGLAFAIHNAGLPVRNMAYLLSCNESRLPTLAAIAEWTREPEGQVRPELTELWNTAICRPVVFQHYELPKILAANPHLGFNWVKSRIAIGIHKSRYGFDEEWQTAIKPLTREQRIELLKMLDKETFDTETFDEVVGDDRELIQEWMNSCEDPRLRLQPLYLFDSIDESWIVRAVCALNAGASPSDVAQYSVPLCYGANDETAESYYGKQVEFYRRLLLHSDSRLHASARRGIKEVTRRMDDEIESRRRRTVYGRE